MSENTDTRKESTMPTILTDPAAVEAAAAAISERNQQDIRTPATSRTYASLWRGWFNWCEQTGEPPLPARYHCLSQLPRNPPRQAGLYHRETALCVW